MLRRSRRIAFWRGEREKPGPFTRGAPAPMGDVMSPPCSHPRHRGDMATGDPVGSHPHSWAAEASLSQGLRPPPIPPRC